MLDALPIRAVAHAFAVILHRRRSLQTSRESMAHAALPCGSRLNMVVAWRLRCADERGDSQPNPSAGTYVRAVYLKSRLRPVAGLAQC